MTTELDRLLPLYWERPEYRHAWQLCFEKEPNRRPLLLRVLAHLPNRLGECEFIENRPSREFVLLVTYDEEDEGARLNAMYIFFTLVATRAVNFIGAEGAWGRVAVEWLRVFPDRQILLNQTASLLSQFKISPHEAAAILVEHETNPVVVWGIEDEKLYKAVLEKYQTRSPDLQKMLDKRVPVLVRNLLSEQKKRGFDISVASLTMANYWGARKLLEEQGVAHAGIFSKPSGKAERGLLDKMLHGEVKDGFTEAIAKVIGGSPNSEVTKQEGKPRWRKWFTRG